MATLIELTVVGQVGLRHDAQHLPAMDGDGAIVESTLAAQGRADDQDREQCLGRLGQLAYGGFHRVQQGILQQQVVYGVGGEAQFRKHDQGGAPGVRLSRQLQCLGHIGHGVGYNDLRHGGPQAQEAVAVERVKIEGHVLSPPVLRPAATLVS